MGVIIRRCVVCADPVAPFLGGSVCSACLREPDRWFLWDDVPFLRLSRDPPPGVLGEWEWRTHTGDYRRQPFGPDHVSKRKPIAVYLRSDLFAVAARAFPKYRRSASRVERSSAVAWRTKSNLPSVVKVLEMLHQRGP